MSLTCVYDRWPLAAFSLLPTPSPPHLHLHPPPPTCTCTLPPPPAPAPSPPHLHLHPPSHPCSCTVLYSNFSPLVIILVGKRGVNLGLLHALLPEIRLKLESVRGIVGSA
jgi:hypothetical protein